MADYSEYKTVCPNCGGTAYAVWWGVHREEPCVECMSYAERCRWDQAHLTGDFGEWEHPVVQYLCYECSHTFEVIGERSV